ncbi:MAG: methyltransferase domain-containing protein [archaeon]
MSVTQVMLFPLKLFFDKIFFPVYKKRLAKIVASMIKDNSYVLDFGCYDGSTAMLIMKYNPTLKIVGVDIQDNQTAKIQRKIYDGKKIPYPDNTFDLVMSLDVLHHTTDIPKHLKEMQRVSKKYVLIKDHAVYSFFSDLLIRFSDYSSNLPYDIKCVFNFPSPDKWMRMFKACGLKIIDQPKNLSFGFWINERYNPIFKLEKI